MWPAADLTWTYRRVSDQGDEQGRAHAAMVSRTATSIEWRVAAGPLPLSLMLAPPDHHFRQLRMNTQCPPGLPSRARGPCDMPTGRVLVDPGRPGSPVAAPPHPFASWRMSGLSRAPRPRRRVDQVEAHSQVGQPAHPRPHTIRISDNRMCKS
jgi:hypothetical protein